MGILLVLLLGASVFWRRNVALTIASSKLTVCDNLSRNPHNVVDNKSCQKKLIITQSIQSNQGGTENLHFYTNKIYDEAENEEARLYYPFIVTLSKSSVRLVYPFYYKATVNNKPFEEVRTKDKCRSEYHAGEDATCGFARDHTGKKIWDSQGFCCSCSRYDFVPRWLRTLIFGGRVHQFYRGDQGGKCGYSHMHSDSDRTSHCMRLDDLWYDVFAIGRYRISFTIDIKAYDEVEKVVNNKTVTQRVDGGTISLNYQKRSGVGKYGRLLAFFLGSFPVSNELPSLTERYLLIPKTKTSATVEDHVQARNGFKDYMLIPKTMVSLLESSDSCDKIGVSYSSFRKQGGGTEGRGPGCQQPKNSCLKNQPKDLFEQDLAIREAGGTPKYFVDTNGKCIGVNRKGSSEDLGIIYELDETMTSLVTLEVSADDMVLVYNRANGVIVKSSATNFDALSKDGKLTVVVQNTGMVTADFYVVFAGCSDGVILNLERTASINPQATRKFEYKLDVFSAIGKRHYCEVQLYDSRRKLQDSSNVTFKTFTQCVCLQDCVCSCNSVDPMFIDEKLTHGEACSEGNSGLDKYDDNEKGGTKKGGGNFLTKSRRLITGIILLSLLLLGIAKAFLGRQSVFIAKFGLGGVRTGKLVTRSINGEKRTLVFNNAMDLLDLTTKELVVPNNKYRDFCVNIFFFLLFPVLLPVNVIRSIASFFTFKPKAAQRLPFNAPNSAETPSETPSTGERKPRRLHKLAAMAPKFKTGSPKLIAHANARKR